MRSMLGYSGGDGTPLSTGDSGISRSPPNKEAKRLAHLEEQVDSLQRLRWREQQHHSRELALATDRGIIMGGGGLATGAVLAAVCAFVAFRSRRDATVAKKASSQLAVELQQVQRTMKADLEAAKKFGSKGFVKDVLEVVDDLERAIGAPPAISQNNEDGIVPETSEQLVQLHKAITEHEPDVLHSFISGIPLIQNRLVRSLAGNNVTRLDPPSGDVFNPDLHEACATVPGDKVNTIAQVLQVGYLLHGQVLRPARVTVIVAPPRETQDQPKSE